MWPGNRSWGAEGARVRGDRVGLLVLGGCLSVYVNGRRLGPGPMATDLPSRVRRGPAPARPPARPPDAAGGFRGVGRGAEQCGATRVRRGFGERWERRIGARCGPGGVMGLRAWDGLAAR